MGTNYIDWDASWTTTSINNSTITTSSTSTTAAISNDLKVSTLVSVEVTNGASNTTGAKVRILSDVDGTDYEVAADLPSRVFQLPSTSSTTFRRTFVVPASDYDDFKVSVENDSGNSNSMTAVYVRYKQAVITTV